mgnify:CR=1 FL=1
MSTGPITSKKATATGSLIGGRTRLKGFIVKTAGSGNPQLVFRSGGASGTTLLDVALSTGDDTQITIPDQGILFDDGCHVTLTAVTSITAFFG